MTPGASAAHVPASKEISRRCYEIKRLIYSDDLGPKVFKVTNV